MHFKQISCCNFFLENVFFPRIYIQVLKFVFSFQEPLSPSLVNIKTELPDPDEGDDPLGPSPSLDLDDDSIRSALILGSDDLGPVGGKLQLQMEDQSEGNEFLGTENSFEL